MKRHTDTVARRLVTRFSALVDMNLENNNKMPTPNNLAHSAIDSIITMWNLLENLEVKHQHCELIKATEALESVSNAAATSIYGSPASRRPTEDFLKTTGFESKNNCLE